MESSLKSVIDAHADRLHAIDGVISVAEGRDNGIPCIMVFLAKDDAAAREKIMAILADHKVKIKITDKPTLHNRDD